MTEGQPRDSQRAKVYAAEKFVRTLFDRAADHHSRAIDFFGTALTLPPEARFAELAAVRRYVEDVLQLDAVARRWPQPGPLTVRERRGQHTAHYESPGIIAIPQIDRWALRELVVLHEIAHHLTPTGAAHGSQFVTNHTELAGLVMGAEVAHVLRVVYAKEGVR